MSAVNVVNLARLSAGKYRGHFLRGCTGFFRCRASLMATYLAITLTYSLSAIADEPQRQDMRDCLERAIEQSDDDTTLGQMRAACEAELKGTNETGETKTSLQTPLRQSSPYERRFGREIGLLVDQLGFMPHRPNLVLPATYGDGFLRNDASANPYEIQFQVSLKLPFTPKRHSENPELPVLFFAYTGSAWWQAYDSRRSRPFREYNHSPEVFLSVPTGQSALGWTWRSFQFGFEHQSNGRASETSRSWNRLFTQFDLDRRSNHWLSLRSWWRIPEDAKENQTDPEGDDNPDITRFLGHHELRFGYSTTRLSWSVMLRRSLRSTGKGAAELTISYPTGFNPRTRWVLRAFDGYGESLIDYNRRVRRIGIGLMLNDWY